MNAPPLRIGIAGLGTVGRGTLKVLRANADLLALRAGRELRPVAVSARTRTKDRGVSGMKGKKRRANAVFADSHVELRRDAPKRIFTLELD